MIVILILPWLDLIQCRIGLIFVITTRAIPAHRRAIITRNHWVSAKNNKNRYAFKEFTPRIIILRISISYYCQLTVPLILSFCGTVVLAVEVDPATRGGRKNNLSVQCRWLEKKNTRNSYFEDQTKSLCETFLNSYCRVSKQLDWSTSMQ